MGQKEIGKIGIGDAPALSDVNRAQTALPDPVAHRRLGHLQPVCHFPDGLVLILGHRLLLLLQSGAE
jgi:hypothetical protein